MLNGVTVGEKHTASYGGCVMRKQVVEIQNMRAEQRMTCRSSDDWGKDQRVEEKEKTGKSSQTRRQNLETDRMVLPNVS